MRLDEIYAFLDRLSPFSLQESWDNSGILVGSADMQINKIALSIDVDEAQLDMLEPNTLLITHHPLIFSGLKSLHFESYPANLLQKMVQKNIANIAMHTNFDQTHLNRYVAQEILGFENCSQEGFVTYFDVNASFETFAKKVAAKLGLKHLKTVQTCEYVKRGAITTGSGCSLMRSVDAECFLTGDIKYHDAMEAKSMKLSLIEIGHYESEHYFAQILEKHLKNLGLEVIIASSQNPFNYFTLNGTK